MYIYIYINTDIRSTTPAPHHRRGREKVPHPTTPQGERGTVLWLTHDHGGGGEGGWNAGPYIYI